MRILYVSQYFPPEMGAPAARVHELSREWARRGHNVTVLTGFAHHPTGIKSPRDRWVLTRREAHDGIDVVRSYVYATANKGMARRTLSYASFMGSAMLVGAVRVARPDIVIATSPQLLCACAGYALARRFRVPFVFEVRDLWPESILAVDAMRENVLVRALKKVAYFLYRHSDRIVTVGNGYKEEIYRRYGIPVTKMSVVPNGIDTGLFIPSPQDNEVRKQYGWEGRFVVLYLGTHGMAHGLAAVLQAARLLRDASEIRFVFVGEGAEKDDLKRRAAELTNVQFIDQQPKERVPLFYAACDLGLVTLRDTPLFQSVLPSKIFEYLGMERAILLTVGGEARRLVEDAGAGIYVPPDNPQALAEGIQQAYQTRQMLPAMGRRGRQYVLSHYDRQVLAGRYLDTLEQVLDGIPRPKSTWRERSVIRLPLSAPLGAATRDRVS
jgi:glycosyltransferase involved in cell wall biosynthesis